jgi:hypothetical protein
VTVGALGMVSQVTSIVTTVNWQFPHIMRIAPTITTYNPGAANANCRDTTGADLAVTVDPNSSKNEANVEIQCAGAGAANHHVIIQASADAGI